MSKKKKVLLVDDEPDIVFVTKKILLDEGYDVVIAKDGGGCETYLEKDRPDLILLDIMMPNKDGWEVCRKIKEDPRTKDIPVAMFTVRVSHDSVVKSFEYAKADAQIDKPFQKEELLKTVRFLLSGSKQS